MITEHLAELVRSALASAVADGVVGDASLPTVEFERPRRPEHGDWATNAALAVGGGNPRAIAEAIVDRLPASDLVERVEVAGPGFINFHLADAWLHDVVGRAADPDSRFGRNDEGAGRKVNVEYVSANPTGPISVVSGRHAAVGDAVSNLLEATGHQVTREFYINDYGRQADLFGQSVAARYLQHFGVDAELPEDGYKGEYLIDLAAEIAKDVGEIYVSASPEDRVAALLRLGLERMLAQMKASLERFGTRFEVWFSERSLHESGAVAEVVEGLKTKGLAEERDGAVWFKSSVFGDDKDRVLVRANGEPTYAASDAAYLIDKFQRDFDHLIYLWGADHHGYIARQLAAAEALGFARDAVEIAIVQIVKLSHGVETLKGSKRAGVVFP
ncbi:MAG: arginine--tRNA ligase, partial [Actinomycetota bacterium]